MNRSNGHGGSLINRHVIRALVAGALVMSSTALAMTGGAALDVPAGSKASAVPPTRLAVFNNPLAHYSLQAPAAADGEAPRMPVPGVPSGITTDIVALLASATSGATVTIAMFSSNGDDAAGPTADTTLVKRALKEAAGRVRALNVLADGHRGEAFWKGLERMPRVSVRLCDGACFRPGTSSMHNKFLLVDDTNWTPIKENVVLQMTANWSDSQLSSRLWNSAIQVWGDPLLYAGYLRYHRQLSRCAPRCLGLPRLQNFGGLPDSGVEVAVFPRPDADDPVLEELADFTGCGKAGSVEIAMNDWRQDPRGLAILARLEQLAERGCTVRIVVPEGVNGHGIGALLPASSLAGTAHCTSHRDAVTKADTSSTVREQRDFVPRVHSKYLLMNGRFRGVGRSTVVSTGSERFAGESRYRADETWMTLTSTPTANIQNAVVHAQFRANFDEMYAVTPPCVIEDPDPR